MDALPTGPRVRTGLDAWIEEGRRVGALAVLAGAARLLARARGLDPDAVNDLLGDPARPPDGLPALRSVDELGALHEATRADPSHRKPLGAFYTPPALADAVVNATLSPLLRGACPPAELRVADPSCGAGAFLVRAVRRIASAGGGTAGEVVRRCVVGVDRDPLAAAVCRTVLWLEAADTALAPEEVADRIVEGDALFVELGERELDAVVGNPPWDVEKPDARAFFERFDPEHRRRSKQDAARVQRELCASDPEIASAWRAERERFGLRARRCRERFRLQPHSGDVNAYQRFVELGLDLLRHGGRLGMLVPAGLYADLGSRRLRDALLDEHGWERLCGFENRARLFPGVDGRFKLAAIVVRKGDRTEAVDASFMRKAASDLLRTGVRVPRATVAALSPRSRAFVELDDDRALALLGRLHARGTTFGDGAWQIGFRRELDLTLDSHRFLLRERSVPGTLLSSRPVWEGRMIGSYDFAEKGWVRGHGRSAVWRTIPWPEKAIEPQYLVPEAELARVDPAPDRPKVGFMAVGSATNTRTMIATVLWRAPCGNSVPTLRCRPAPSGAPGELALCAALNSTVYDWALRARMAGNNLNRFVLDDTPLPDPDVLLAIEGLAAAVASLCWPHPWFDAAWDTLPPAERARALPLIDPILRRRARAALDAVVAAAWGLSSDDLGAVLRDCDLPSAELARRRRDGSLDPKGLWRIDRDLPPDERLPGLSLAALRRLEERTANGTPLARAAADILTPPPSQARVSAL